MAGTGNLEVLRICRHLRSRVGPPYNLYVMYGSHMAISISVGLLFLGGCRYTNIYLNTILNLIKTGNFYFTYKVS